MQKTYKVAVVHYWNADFSHAPYQFVFRDPISDEEIDKHDLLRKILIDNGINDGDEIEIVVHKTGNRPFDDRRIRLIKPHTYERET